MSAVATRPGAGPAETAEPRDATEPPEARGLARDEVRLLAPGPAGLEDARFRDLPRYLREGDLLVVNTSATLAAAVDGRRAGRPDVVVHFSTPEPDGTWLVELRTAERGRLRDGRPGERVTLAGGATVDLLVPVRVGPDGPRLWRARIGIEGATAAEPGRALEPYLAAHGRPISYAYVPGRWPLADYQTVFATDPGSAEMPSAGRPFTADLVTALVAAGVTLAPITLHTGVSSLERGEAPAPEWFRVPPVTARLVNSARAAGGRVVAVGTTVTRALESAAAVDRTVAPAQGWTGLVLGPDRPARVVDGIVTGWHALDASHLLLLEAVAGGDRVRAAYAAALDRGYLWHEFGDSCLLLRDAP